MRFTRGMLAVLLAGGMTQAHAQVLQRELGDFELKLGTTPARSMAQGLIQPTRTNAFTGMVDLTAPSGWYVGQWAPSIGALASASTTELNSYLGYMQPSGERLGYEFGLIHYSFPEARAQDRQAIYTGLNLYGSRLGAAWSESPQRSDGTVLLDLDLLRPWYLDVTLKYGRHTLAQPVRLSDRRAERIFDDWSLNISRPWLGLRLGLAYSGSDLGGRGCLAYSGQNSRCDDYLQVQIERPLF